MSAGMESGRRGPSRKGPKPIGEMGLEGLSDIVPKDMVVPEEAKVSLTDDGRPLIEDGYWEMVFANPWLKSRSAMRREHMVPNEGPVAANVWQRKSAVITYDMYDSRKASPEEPGEKTDHDKDDPASEPEICPLCGRTIKRGTSIHGHTVWVEGQGYVTINPNSVRLYDSYGNSREIDICNRCLGALRSIMATVPPAPAHVPKAIVVDTETTGLDAGQDELLSVGIVDLGGRPVWSSLVRPERTLSWPEAEAVNGIGLADVSLAPTARQVVPVLQSIVDRTREVVGYNVDFDAWFLSESGVDLSRVVTTDVMEPFSRLCGEEDPKGGGYKLQSLSVAAGYFDYDWSNGPGAHNALADAAATAWVWSHMRARDD